jgi:hypothetical protein
MAILDYGNRRSGRATTKLNTYEEAAIFDFILKEASVREAAKALNKPDLGNGIYALTLAALRGWIERGVVDADAIRADIMDRLETENKSGRN